MSLKSAQSIVGLYVQEPEVLEPGAGAGMQDVTELDAWQKCAALSAVGMSVQEVLPHDRDDSLYIGHVTFFLQAGSG